MQRWIIVAAVSASVFASAPPATWAYGAAGGGGRAHAQSGQQRHVHTGQEQKIGPYEIELAVKGSEATLAISDERDQPVDASAFSATAVALARGNERRTMEFRPAGVFGTEMPVTISSRLRLNSRCGVPPGGR